MEMCLEIWRQWHPFIAAGGVGTLLARPMWRNVRALQDMDRRGVPTFRASADGTHIDNPLIG